MEWMMPLGEEGTPLLKMHLSAFPLLLDMSVIIQSFCLRDSHQQVQVEAIKGGKKDYYDNHSEQTHIQRGQTSSSPQPVPRCRTTPAAPPSPLLSASVSQCQSLGCLCQKEGPTGHRAAASITQSHFQRVTPCRYIAAPAPTNSD